MNPLFRCTDGFSRRILWLRASYINHQPGLIARFFLEAVSTCGGYPSRVRTDCGTENVQIAAIQSFISGYVRRLPYASTCDMRFFLPRGTGPQDLGSMMEQTILECNCFGFLWLVTVLHTDNSFRHLSFCIVFRLYEPYLSWHILTTFWQGCSDDAWSSRRGI